MSRNKAEKNIKKDELVHSGKILPEVERRMVKGERTNIIIVLKVVIPLRISGVFSTRLLISSLRSISSLI